MRALYKKYLGMGILLAGLCLGSLPTTQLLVSPAEAQADSADVLVFGEADNGTEGNNLVTTLRQFGYAVDQAKRLPADITKYSSIWYIEAYRGLGPTEETALNEFVKRGGGLYLTGERPCCETLNQAVQRVINGLLVSEPITVGGRGDVPGSFTFNAGATQAIASTPNLLVDFVPQSPGFLGGISNLADSNVFASSESVAVGGAWADEDLVGGKGRLALLMDIDWLKSDRRVPIVENIQAFLTRTGGCSNDRHWDGFLWAGPLPTRSPSNCSTLIGGSAVEWMAGTEDGVVTIVATASGGAGAECSYTRGPAAISILRCVLSSPATGGGRLRVTASDNRGASSRNYRVVPKNDLRNVPVPFQADVDWWDLPDGDDDGIPDHWENEGVWVRGQFLDLKALGANSKKKDLFVYVDYLEGEKFSEGVLSNIRQSFSKSPLKNPDGSEGVNIHIEQGAAIPQSIVGDLSAVVDKDDSEAARYAAARARKEAFNRLANRSGFAGSSRSGDHSVPQFYKYFFNTSGLAGNVIGIADAIPGNFGFTAVNKLTGDKLEDLLAVKRWGDSAVDFAKATNLVHEFGHLVGLFHHGATSAPNNDPEYKSVMSYAYSTTGIPQGLFDLGKTRIDYSRESTVNLDWEMGEPDGKLTFIPGQWGEEPDFYSSGAFNELRFGNGPPLVEETLDDIVRSVPDEAIDALVAEFGLEVVTYRPQARSFAVSTTNGSPVPVTLVGSDRDNDPLSFEIDLNPKHGSLSGTAPNLVYTPAVNFVGNDSFEYSARDSHLRSAAGLVSITVTELRPVTFTIGASAATSTIYATGVPKGAGVEGTVSGVVKGKEMPSRPLTAAGITSIDGLETFVVRFQFEGLGWEVRFPNGVVGRVPAIQICGPSGCESGVGVFASEANVPPSALGSYVPPATSTTNTSTSTTTSLPGTTTATTATTVPGTTTVTSVPASARCVQLQSQLDRASDPGVMAQILASMRALGCPI